MTSTDKIGQVINQAVWRSVEEIKTEGAKIYPDGFESVLMELV